MFISDSVYLSTFVSHIFVNEVILHFDHEYQNHTMYLISQLIKFNGMLNSSWFLKWCFQQARCALVPRRNIERQPLRMCRIRNSQNGTSWWKRHAGDRKSSLRGSVQRFCGHCSVSQYRLRVLRMKLSGPAVRWRWHLRPSRGLAHKYETGLYWLVEEE